jgi:hypothetical protein
MLANYDCVYVCTGSVCKLVMVYASSDLVLAHVTLL